TGFVLTCRMADGSGSGWAGITGIKDVTMIDAKALTEVASNKALKSRKPKKIEPGRYTVILEPRANARFLSLMTGVFGGGGGGVAGGGGFRGCGGIPGWRSRSRSSGRGRRRSGGGSRGTRTWRRRWTRRWRRP